VINKPRIVIAGASGYVGRAVSKNLAVHFDIIGLTRGEIEKRKPTDPVSEWRKCDLFSLLDAEKALIGADFAIYLVHSMLPSSRLTQGNFEDMDLIAADNFARAAEKNGVKHIIYLGGLIPSTGETLSTHLASRLEVEETFNFRSVASTCLRAGMIIGPRSSSFSIVVRLVKRLPIMICPKWTETLTQPIALEDVVKIINFCINKPNLFNKTFDIGGPDVLTYRNVMGETAKYLGLKRLFIKFDRFTPGLSRLWISLVTGAPKALVKPLIESLKYKMVANNLELQEAANIPGLNFKETLKSSLELEKPTFMRTPKAFQPAKENKGVALVRSIQRLPLPKNRSAEWVAREYMRWLPTCLPFFFLNVVQEDEKTFAIKLPLLRKPLLVLQYAVSRSWSGRHLYYIRGGLLARSEGRGRLEFRTVLNGRALIAGIHDYQPTLPWMIYTCSQALFHLYVMRSFRKHLQRIV
jgi:uncharacterized protein YbjT (DUF2867 family)